ncbi:MAG: Ig-like domain-containing protein [Bacteroidales bacterium]|nr:Ig-like domain-containing protein [Bacteroidales bacterium]
MKKLISILFCGQLLIAGINGQLCSDTFTGDGTFYGYGGGGNCSFPYPGKPALTGAMNQVQYNGSEMCGACVEVTGRKGTLMISIEDRCPECKHGDIDLSEDAFPYIDDKIHGRVPISWKIVPCPVQGPIKLYFKEGSSQWWTAVQVRNHKYPVAKLEYKVKEKWVNVKRMMYNYFLVASGMGPGPFDFRITDIYGSVIIEKNVPLKITTEITGTKQFPDCGNSGTIIDVTGVELSKSTLALSIGEKHTLTADIIPANATNKNIQWNVKNPSIASIDDQGEVTALVQGSTQVEVITEDGGKKAVCSVIVSESTNNCNFGTPMRIPLPSVNKEFKHIHVLGLDGPDLSNVLNMTINWDVNNSGLWQFSMLTDNGQPNWYIDLRNFSNSSFDAVPPAVNVKNSGIANFDGEYYVAKYGSDFVMKSKYKDFTIYYSNSPTSPNCEKSAFDTKNIGDGIKIYPVPFHQQLYIEIDDVENFEKLEVYNSSGQLITSKKRNSLHGNMLNLNLPENYLMVILRIHMNNKVLTKSVVSVN